MVEKKVVSIRLAEQQVEYLGRIARRLGRTPSQTAAMLLDEGLRRERFPQIEIRDTAAGRTAYIRGTRLPVWMMASQMWKGETPAALAEALGVQETEIRAALDYAETFRDEIELAIEDDREGARNIPNLPGYTPWPPNSG